jgi:ABC-type lipoprotein release transport system permease subunit
MSDVRFAFRKLHQSPAFSSIAGIKLVLGIGLHTAIFSLTGIRMALGAQTSDVLRLIVSQGMKPVLVGLAIGVLATFVALIAAQLYHVSAQNPALLAAATVLLIGTALFACLLPARRATLVDRVQALRAD